MEISKNCFALCLLSMVFTALVTNVSSLIIEVDDMSSRRVGWPPRGRAPTERIQLVTPVVNLDSRADRWAAFQEAWRSVESVRLHRLSAVPHYPSSAGGHTINGCTASHIKAVEEAFAADPELQVALVLEDDAVPRPNFDEIFPHVLEYALSHLEDWHIINLGTSIALPSRKAEDQDERDRAIFQYRSRYLLRTSVWSSAHAVLMNRRALPIYARMKESFVQYDRTASESCADYILSRDQSVVVLSAVPLLVSQSEGFSNVRMQLTNYTGLFGEAESVLWDMVRILGTALRDWSALMVTERNSTVQHTEYMDWGSNIARDDSMPFPPLSAWVWDTAAVHAVPALLVSGGRPSAETFAAWAREPLVKLTHSPGQLAAGVTGLGHWPSALKEHLLSAHAAFHSSPQQDVVLVLGPGTTPSDDFGGVFPHVLDYARSHLDDWHVIALSTESVLPSPGDNRQPIFQYRTPHLLRVSILEGVSAVLINRRCFVLPSDRQTGAPGGSVDYITLVAQPPLAQVRAAGLRTNGPTASPGTGTAYDDMSSVLELLSARPDIPAVTTGRTLADGGQPYTGWGPNTARAWPDVKLCASFKIARPTYCLPFMAALRRNSTLALGIVPVPAGRADLWAMNLQAWRSVRTVWLQAALSNVETGRHGSAPYPCAICTASHIKAVEEAFAADPGLQVALVLEDDAVPRPNFDEIFSHVLEYALSTVTRWSTISLGCTEPQPQAWDGITSYVAMELGDAARIRRGVCCCSSATLVNRRTLEHMAAGCCAGQQSGTGRIQQDASAPAATASAGPHLDSWILEQFCVTGRQAPTPAPLHGHQE